MNKLRHHSTKIAEAIIDLGQQLSSELETWDEALASAPDHPNKDAFAGRITKSSSTSGIDMVIDVQAMPDEETALLRVWAIHTTQDDAGNERFNNIQLSYDIDRSLGRELVEAGGAPAPEDINSLLNDETNLLTQLVISDLTGHDEANDQPLGNRYDLVQEEIEGASDELCDEITQTMDAVLERIKQAASQN